MTQAMLNQLKVKGLISTQKKKKKKKKKRTAQCQGIYLMPEKIQSILEQSNIATISKVQSYVGFLKVYCKLFDTTMVQTKQTETH
jgi:hypothetical protein